MTSESRDAYFSIIRYRLSQCHTHQVCISENDSTRQPGRLQTMWYRLKMVSQTRAFDQLLSSHLECYEPNLLVIRLLSTIGCAGNFEFEGHPKPSEQHLNISAIRLCPQMKPERRAQDEAGIIVRVHHENPNGFKD